MSIKTLRKRIALVAVSALGAGLMSVTPAFAGAGAVAAGSIVVAANGSTNVTSRGILSTNGTAGTSALAASAVATNYGVILSNGSVYVTGGGNTAATAVAIKVSGGKISSCADTATGTVVINASQTTCTGSAADEDVTATVVPDSGATSLTITAYSDVLTTSVGAITYTVVASSTTNTFSSATSFISVEVTGTAATTNIDAVRTSAAGDDYSATIVPAGLHGYLGYDLKDAYGTALSAHVFGATVTGGCLVGFNQAASANIFTAASTTTASGYISFKSDFNITLFLYFDAY